MKYTKASLLTIALAVIATPVFLLNRSHASDHADTPQIAANPGTDITDVFVFPSPENSDNVVLTMNVHPLIGPGASGGVSFDPNVLYQFKLDTNGDAIEDRVIQVRFEGTGAGQIVKVAGPLKPSMTGARSVAEPAFAVTGTINNIFSPTTGMKVFAGAREDPFFFDLEQFFTIFPDRATPISGVTVADPNTPKATTWRAPGVAKDFLSNGGYNVLSIVIELPRSMLNK